MSKETTTTPTKRELILGQPYDFYPYLEPTSRVHRRDNGVRVIVTDAGVWRRVHKDPTTCDKTPSKQSKWQKRMQMLRRFKKWRTRPRTVTCPCCGQPTR